MTLSAITLLMNSAIFYAVAVKKDSQATALALVLAFLNIAGAVLLVPALMEAWQL